MGYLSSLTPEAETGINHFTEKETEDEVMGSGSLDWQKAEVGFGPRTEAPGRVPGIG